MDLKKEMANIRNALQPVKDLVVFIQENGLGGSHCDDVEAEAIEDAQKGIQIILEISKRVDQYEEPREG